MTSPPSRAGPSASGVGSAASGSGGRGSRSALSKRASRPGRRCVARGRSTRGWTPSRASSAVSCKEGCVDGELRIRSSPPAVASGWRRVPWGALHPVAQLVGRQPDPEPFTQHLGHRTRDSVDLHAGCEPDGHLPVRPCSREARGLDAGHRGDGALDLLVAQAHRTVTANPLPSCCCSCLPTHRTVILV
jgi:hypothetical protein